MINAITGRRVQGSFAAFGATPIEFVQRTNEVRRILAFAGRSIDEVVNCPIARREVISFYRIGNQVRRHAEVEALERQWNPLRRR